MKSVLVGLLFVVSSVAAAGLDVILAPGAEVRKLAGGFSFTEGATVNAAGDVFFTDQPNNRIFQWNEQRGLRTFLDPAGRANGMCFTKDGTLLVCADEKMELWALRPDKTKTVLAKTWNGKAMNGPNDVWSSPKGGCYVTDPFYKRPWWTHQTPPQVSRQVYFLPKGKDAAFRRVTDDLVQPNGIVGTADGKWLFVSDINAKKTYRYAIQPDGTLAGKTLFCEMGSDGMTLDADGRLYLTGKGVTVFSPDGEKLGTIPVPEPWCGNLCIGGKEKNILYITASKGFYSIPLRVKGSPQGK